MRYARCFARRLYLEAVDQIDQQFSQVQPHSQLERVFAPSKKIPELRLVDRQKGYQILQRSLKSLLYHRRSSSVRTGKQLVTYLRKQQQTPMFLHHRSSPA